jgi:predicted DNA binding protein
MGLLEGRLTHLAFRLQHDCPVALLSRDLPDLALRSWSGHTREILHVRTEPGGRARVLEALDDHLPDAVAIPFAHGVVAILESSWPKPESITRRLEDHKALWLQPLRYQGGWEYYDVVSLDDRMLQTYLSELLHRFPLEVVSRGSIDETSLLSAFFVPMNPILEGLTAKQEQALLAAWQQGYYTQPRGTTTRQVARAMGISRSAFEERLRKAENLVINGIAPSLAAYERGGRKER